MNKMLAAQADAKFRGHFAPKRHDERWKHKVSDQMNDALCVCAAQADYESRRAIYSLLTRISEFEEIPFHPAE